MPRPVAVRRGAVVNRRTMLVGTAAAAVPLSAPEIAEASTDEERAVKPLEYRESEHVRQFYAKCRF